MTTVNFYDLPKKEMKAKKICLLTEIFYNQGNRILIIVNNEEEGRILDNLLWCFTPESFIPHKISLKLKTDKNQPVLITTKKENRNNSKILILGREVDIAFILQFDEVVDFAESYDKECLERSRKRYAYYMRQGLTVNYRKKNP
ncbi:MAG: DNA polymerase III subunit chi [Thermodesulfobacteriota bacterium]|nr:DNA polymerase III subunit chi [Thermodesulfobacteriota bacterium]